MSIVSGIFIYVMIWWVVLFTILPWGIRRQKDLMPGCAVEAPARSYILLKFLFTSVLSALIWTGIYWMITSHLITFTEN